MIAGSNEIRDVQKEGIGETNKMSISMDSEVQSHIVKVLTENYKYPLASTIRESASNAWDSHIMSGKKDIPFNVSLVKNNTGGYNLEIEDFGLGLDEEGFNKYYMKLGNSTKRGIAGVLGYYGCGAKAALSYTSSYEVITRKDGMEYKFLIFKGEEFPESTKIYEKETTEGNGVLIRVGIDRYDYGDVLEAINEQLCYFPTAYINVEGSSKDYLNYKIFDNELFSWSEMYPSREMHINFGGVHYPIDWGLLKINRIDIPIGMKIAPDQGINPFFNRESLEYTALAKKTIKEQISKIADYFVNFYNSEWKEEESVVKAWDRIGIDVKKVIVAGQEFVINQLLSYSTISVKDLKIRGIELETPKYYKDKAWTLLDEYETEIDYQDGKWKKKHVRENHSPKKMLEGVKHILIENVPKGHVRKYLLQKYGHRHLYFIKKVKSRQLGKVAKYSMNQSIHYGELLKLADYSKTEWRTRIREFQFVENQWKALIIDETRVENTPEYINWLVAYKEQQKEYRKQYGTSGNYKGLNKGESDITIAYYSVKRGREYTKTKAAYSISELHKNNYLTVYQVEGEESKYDFSELASMFRKVKFCVIGKREVKKLPKCKNFKTIEQFMSQLTKPFVKVVTAKKVDSILETYRTLVNNDIVENVLVALHKDIETLENYVKKYDCNMSSDAANSVYEYAKENNIWDREIMVVANKVEKGMKDYEFISILDAPNSWQTENVLKYKRFINQHLLYKKLYNSTSLPEYKLVKVEEEELVEAI